jgi:transposase InsO family protein
LPFLVISPYAKSNYVNVSVTLDGAFCLEALDEAIRLYGRPEIFNSDQGCQFTSTEFTDRRKTEEIKSAWTAAVGHWTISL